MIYWIIELPEIGSYLTALHGSHSTRKEDALKFSSREEAINAKCNVSISYTMVITEQTEPEKISYLKELGAAEQEYMSAKLKWEEVKSRRDDTIYEFLIDMSLFSRNDIEMFKEALNRDGRTLIEVIGNAFYNLINRND